MEDIKIGDYVRTIDGRIYHFTDKTKKGRSIMLGDKIVKHSPNIIDLIEVGDYVNGSRVDSIENGFITTEFCENLSVTRLEYEIKSIVTKEQFKSVSFEV
jgi:hypothetical protein